jgi:hypothetical protein
MRTIRRPFQGAHPVMDWKGLVGFGLVGFANSSGMRHSPSWRVSLRTEHEGGVVC